MCLTQSAAKPWAPEIREQWSSHLEIWDYPLYGQPLCHIRNNTGNKNTDLRAYLVTHVNGIHFAVCVFFTRCVCGGQQGRLLIACSWEDNSLQDGPDRDIDEGGKERKKIAIGHNGHSKKWEWKQWKRERARGGQAKRQEMQPPHLIHHPPIQYQFLKDARSPARSAGRSYRLRSLGHMPGAM